MFTSDVYKERRLRLVAGLHGHGINHGLVVLAAHSESPINYHENCYPFRQDSNWLYFIGLNAPDMLASIDIAEGGTVLFGEDPSLDDMIWTGPRPGLVELARRSGIADTMPRRMAKEHFDLARREGNSILYLPPCRAETERLLSDLLGIPGGALKDRASLDLIKVVISLREIKEDREVAELEKATAVTAEMHKALLSALRPGWTEQAAASLVRHEAEKRGCSLSFATIATTHGEVLHNHERNGVCGEGGTFLLDAGAETPSGYAGDLTTTFPIGTQFSPRQADIYRLLLTVFSDATRTLSPGTRFFDAHMTACRTLAEGLSELGILKGSPEDAVREGAHALFFPHGLGHMIGLDVHDMEGLGEDLVGYSDTPRSAQFGLHSLRLAKTLLSGMVHSVEPGIYFIPRLIDAWKAEQRHADFIDYGELEKWRGCGGMRIEEDWLITDKGARRLGPAFDKSMEAIEIARSSI